MNPVYPTGPISIQREMVVKKVSVYIVSMTVIAVLLLSIPALAGNKLTAYGGKDADDGWLALRINADLCYGDYQYGERSYRWEGSGGYEEYYVGNISEMKRQLTHSSNGSIQSRRLAWSTFIYFMDNEMDGILEPRNDAPNWPPGILPYEPVNIVNYRTQIDRAFDVAYQTGVPVMLDMVCRLDHRPDLYDWKSNPSRKKKVEWHDWWSSGEACDHVDNARFWMAAWAPMPNYADPQVIDEYQSRLAAVRVYINRKTRDPRYVNLFAGVALRNIFLCKHAPKRGHVQERVRVKGPEFTKPELMGVPTDEDHGFSALQTAWSNTGNLPRMPEDQKDLARRINPRWDGRVETIPPNTPMSDEARDQLAGIVTDFYEMCAMTLNETRLRGRITGLGIPSEMIYMTVPRVFTNESMKEYQHTSLWSAVNQYGIMGGDFGQIWLDFARNPYIPGGALMEVLTDQDAGVDVWAASEWYPPTAPPDQEPWTASLEHAWEEAFRNTLVPREIDTVVPPKTVKCQIVNIYHWCSYKEGPTHIIEGDGAAITEIRKYIEPRAVRPARVEPARVFIGE